MINGISFAVKLIYSRLTPIDDFSKCSTLEIIDILEPLAESNGITTLLQKAHFFGQLAHESRWFRFVSENLNYSSKALSAVFGKYFTSDMETQEFGRQPEKIANRVYANRMGNGEEASGEGWKYIGRGLIQIRGKKNYQRYAQDRGIDFVSYPDLLLEPKWAVDSAAWFWSANNLNEYANRDDLKTITKKINGGYNGLQDRERCVNIFKEILAQEN